MTRAGISLALFFLIAFLYGFALDAEQQEAWKWEAEQWQVVALASAFFFSVGYKNTYLKIGALLCLFYTIDIAITDPFVGFIPDWFVWAEALFFLLLGGYCWCRIWYFQGDQES